MSKPDPFKSGSTRNWSKPIWFYQDNRAPLLSVTPRNWHDLWKQLALPYTVAFCQRLGWRPGFDAHPKNQPMVINLTNLRCQGMTHPPRFGTHSDQLRCCTFLCDHLGWNTCCESTGMVGSPPIKVTDRPVRGWHTLHRPYPKPVTTSPWDQPQHVPTEDQQLFLP